MMKVMMMVMVMWTLNDRATQLLIKYKSGALVTQNQAGTYGLWSALLAGGEVIYPAGYGTRLTVVTSFAVFVNVVDCLVLLSLIWNLVFGLVTVVTVKMSRCLPYYIRLVSQSKSIFSQRLSGRVNHWASKYEQLDSLGYFRSFITEKETLHWLNTIKTTTSFCLKRIDFTFPSIDVTNNRNWMN